MKELMALAALAAASASAVEMTDGGFKVTETAPVVRLVTVYHGYQGDLSFRREGITDPASPSRNVRFSSDAVAYHVCAGDSYFNLESSVVATVARSADGTWTEVKSSAGTGDGVRITSITLRGSVPEVTVDVDPKFGSTVAVEGKANLADPEWRPAAKGHRFFRAVQY